MPMFGGQKLLDFVSNRTLPQPVPGQARTWMPGPMPDVPYMPAVQMPQQQTMQRYVDPNSPEMVNPMKMKGQGIPGLLNMLAQQGMAMNPNIGLLVQLLQQAKRPKAQQAPPATQNFGLSQPPQYYG